MNHQIDNWQDRLRNEWKVERTMWKLISLNKKSGTMACQTLDGEHNSSCGEDLKASRN